MSKPCANRRVRLPYRCHPRKAWVQRFSGAISPYLKPVRDERRRPFRPRSVLRMMHRTWVVPRMIRGPRKSKGTVAAKALVWPPKESASPVPGNVTVMTKRVRLPRTCPIPRRQVTALALPRRDVTTPSARTALQRPNVVALVKSAALLLPLRRRTALSAAALDTAPLTQGLAMACSHRNPASLGMARRARTLPSGSCAARQEQIGVAGSAPAVPADDALPSKRSPTRGNKLPVPPARAVETAAITLRTKDHF